MSNTIHTCIENFIIGNLKDAKRQAKRIDAFDLLESLVEDFGKTRHQATKIAYYLKHPSQATFQAACDAQ